jgi:DNA-binding response OmpR family regulator
MGFILVVEDERGVAETLKAILEDEGHRVILASNGRDAFAILARERPDLVVADLMLPLMSGQALYQAMQADEQLRRIPFLVVSALDVDLIRRQLPGVTALPKPFRISQILTAVDALIAKKRSDNG